MSRISKLKVKESKSFAPFTRSMSSLSSSNKNKESPHDGLCQVYDFSKVEEELKEIRAWQKKMEKMINSKAEAELATLKDSKLTTIVLAWRNHLNVRLYKKEPSKSTSLIPTKAGKDFMELLQEATESINLEMNLVVSKKGNFIKGFVINDALGRDAIIKKLLFLGMRPRLDEGSNLITLFNEKLHTLHVKSQGRENEYARRNASITEKKILVDSNSNFIMASKNSSSGKRKASSRNSRRNKKEIFSEEFHNIRN